jgi:hypothetical protein
MLYKYGVLQWQKVFGGAGADEFFHVKATADGGAIAVGRSYSLGGNITANKGGEDIIVTKYDAAGNLEWNKNYCSSLLICRQSHGGGYQQFAAYTIVDGYQ